MRSPRVDGSESRPSVDLRLSLTSTATALPWRCVSSASQDPPSSDRVLAAARAVGEAPGAFLVGGEDSIRRVDLELLKDLSGLRPLDLGLCTLGHGIDAPRVHDLAAAGVQRVRVSFHSARQDAHDWLVGQPGSLRAAHRAIRTCLEADMPVEVETVLTRPTLLCLPETIEVLTRIGVRKIYVRRLTAMDIDAAGFVSLSPRLLLMEAALEQAAAIALQKGIRLILLDLPVCVAPRLRPLFGAPERERWIMADGSVRMRAEGLPGCANCPGLPRCAGAPRDYVERFGWEELGTPGLPESRVHESVDDQKAPPASTSMSFTWAGLRRVTCPSCGDPESEIGGQPYEPTRRIRARLVQAARYRPAVLRLVGADLLAHPQATSLIHDALRLFRHVEVAGEASAMADWTDLDLRRLKELKRLDVALYGPDAATHDAHCGIPGAFVAMQRGVERLRSDTSIAVGSYAIVHEPSIIPAFAGAWDRGLLPGEPRFRLSAQGGSLDELVQCACALPPSKTRAALLAVLPRCLCEVEGLDLSAKPGTTSAENHLGLQQWIHLGRNLPYQPCGSDPIGSFEECSETLASCSASGCPGAAVGWHRAARSTQWTASL